MRKTCIVTGASGFLGKVVAEKLAEDCDVTPCGHSTVMTAGRACDLRNPDAVKALIANISPDVVVHSAAYRDPDFCEQNPEEARRLNVESVRAFRDHLPPDATLVFISSDYVFSGDTPPYREDDACDPVNVYGETKVEAEALLKTRPNTICLRIPVLIGAGPTLAESGYVGQLVRAARDRSEQIHDHYHVRYPTWNVDVAAAIAFLLTTAFQGTIHFSGPRAATRYESALDVADLLGESSDHLRPSTGSVARGARRPADSALSTERIRALGCTQFTDLREVTRRVVDLFPNAQ